MANTRTRRNIERRRKLRREMTVEAALAKSTGLDVRNQVARSRNGAMWAASGLGLLAATWLPAFFAGGDAATGGIILEAFTLVPMLGLARRAWHLHHAAKALDDEDEPELTAGDDEVARLRELVRSMATRSAKRAGTAAIAATRQAYKERRRHFERRHQFAALQNEAETDASRAAMADEVASCDKDIASLDAQLDKLLASVAHLAEVSATSRSTAIQRVRDSTDAVNALADAITEVEAPPSLPQPRAQPG
jgi:hypothetical protein